jgi:hypothetical protein
MQHSHYVDVHRDVEVTARANRTTTAPVAARRLGEEAPLSLLASLSSAASVSASSSASTANYSAAVAEMTIEKAHECGGGRKTQRRDDAGRTGEQRRSMRLSSSSDEEQGPDIETVTHSRPLSC